LGKGGYMNDSAASLIIHADGTATYDGQCQPGDYFETQLDRPLTDQDIKEWVEADAQGKLWIPPERRTQG
jgi:hypothetical protein